ncbi:ABC transporter substrate-binding protein [Pseudofrankia inefficax]|uniref:Extracellular solute-binding protein family 5 n=1 Tax=Pseudofrankia inefficax (strain DSM 45817 / CECT 9037 / DDB 130130 / EuI1c) TaxID=298654 RepID=E3JCX8_PSEI1|nr:ABC transporter substrate-binding protein [Pseudofrankia inefficax]ADP81117.1 extracellular solute-binding protein family 5 [Pseudofrankia inefficax]
MRSRPVLAGAAALAATAAMLLAACGSGGSSAAAPASQPRSGGNLTYALDVEPQCFDAAVSPQDVTGEVDRNILDSLVSEDTKGTFHPWLAKSWDVSKDLTTYTFHLRGGVKFTDGTVFDANAVKVNFDRIVAPTTKSQYASNLLGPYTGTKVIDPSTVQVSFSKPFAPFLQVAATAYLGFYSPTAIRNHPEGFCVGGPSAVGTGPFTFTSATKGQSILLSRNPAYNWGPADSTHTGPAYLDKVTYRILTEAATRIGSLTSGQVDGIQSVPPSNVASLASIKSINVYKKDDPGGVYNLYLNVTRPILSDQRVRQAIQRGIDIDQNVKTVYFGQYSRAWSPISPATPSYDAKLEGSWPYDPALANKLLDEAGWTGRDSAGYRTKDGQRLTVVWPSTPSASNRDSRDVLAQAIVADLKKIGIEISRPSFDVTTYLTKAYASEFDVLDTSWARFDPDVLRLFFNSASRGSNGQNGAFLADDQVDQWTNAGAQTLDPTVRNDVYAKTQQRVIQLAADVPVYVPRSLFATQSSVQDLAFSPNAWPEFYGTWLSK